MAISGYSTPAELSAIDTYVPIPFQQLAESMDRRQGIWDSSVEVEGKAHDALAQQRGLAKIINAGTNTYTDLNDERIVNEKVAEYENRIAELGKQHTDKSSVGYRRELQKLVNDLRYELGENGTFGISASNRKVGEELSKLIQSNPDNLAYRYADIVENIQQGINPDGMSRLSLDASLYKGIDIQEKMAKFVSQMRTITNDPTLIENYMGKEGLNALRQSGSISKERLRDVAKKLMAEDPEIANELRLMNKYAGQQGGEFDSEAFIDRVANNLADLYEGKDVKINTFWDPKPINTPGNDDTPGIPNPTIPQYARNENTPIKDSGTLNSRIETAKTSLHSLAEIKEHLDGLEKAFEAGELDENPFEGEGILIGEKRFDYDSYIDLKVAYNQALSEYKSLKNLEEAAFKEAGAYSLTQEEINEEIKNLKKLDDKRREGEKYQISFFSGGDELNAKWAEIDKKYDNMEYSLEDVVKRGTSRKVKGVRKEVDKILERRAEDATVTANIHSVLTSSKNPMERSVAEWLKEPSTKESMIKGGLTYFGTEPNRKGTVSQDVVNKIDVSKSTTGSWTYNPTPGKESEILMLIDARNSEGVNLGRMYIPADYTFKLKLAAAGQLDMEGSEFQQTIMSNINRGNGIGTFSFQSGSGDNAAEKSFRVTRPGVEPNAYTGSSNDWVISTKEKNTKTGDIVDVVKYRFKEQAAMLAKVSEIISKGKID